MNTSAKPHADHRRQPGELPEPTATFSGCLLENAQARTKAIDSEGHMVPVLCLDIELDGAWRNRLCVEQPFAADQHAACVAAAYRYRKGAHITVEAPVSSLRMVATNATHIHVLQREETPA